MPNAISTTFSKALVKLLLLPALLVALLGAVSVGTAGAGGTTGATAATAATAASAGVHRASADVIAQAPVRRVIVEVEGDRGNGFTLYYADGSSISPPTDSEAAAECSEYDDQLARVRCRVEVRTWYRDLGDLKKSLAWVRSHR